MVQLDCSFPSVQLGKTLHCVLSVQLGLVVQLGPGILRASLSPSVQLGLAVQLGPGILLASSSSVQLGLAVQLGLSHGYFLGCCWLILIHI